MPAELGNHQVVVLGSAEILKVAETVSRRCISKYYYMILTHHEGVRG